MTRRRPVHRLTSALIGAIVTASGALTIAMLSGYDLDTELIVIIALSAIGGWLLITALLAGRTPRRPRDAFPGDVRDEPTTPGSPVPIPAVAGPPAPYASGSSELDLGNSADALAGADAEPVATTPPLTAAARRAAARAAEKARAQGADGA